MAENLEDRAGELTKLFTATKLEPGSGIDVVALFVAAIVSIHLPREHRRDSIEQICSRIWDVFDELDEKLGIGQELQ